MYDQVETFIGEHTQQWSANTIERYRRALLRFLASMPDPSATTASEFSGWLNAQGWGSSARYIAYQAVKQFLRWNFGAHHPALKLKIKRKTPPPGRVLDLDQVRQLMQSCDTSTAMGWRNLSILSLMIDTGLRCSEVCNLQLKYLDLKNSALQVVVKGGQWSQRVYSDHTAAYLSTWLSWRAPLAKCDTVFISLGGNTPGNRLTKNGLLQIFKYWGKRVGFHVSPHDLRRTMASLATKRGAPEDVVMKAGGWTDPEVFRRYTVGVTQDDFRRWFPSSAAME